MALVVLVVLGAVGLGAALGWIASRLHAVIGPAVVMLLVATAFAVTIGAAAAESNTDLHVVYGLVALVALSPLWVSMMATITWVATRHDPIAGPRVLGLVALAIAAGLLVLAAGLPGDAIANAIPGLAHLVIAIVLCGLSSRRRRGVASGAAGMAGDSPGDRGDHERVAMPPGRRPEVR